jgi:hypothetical protein
MAKNTAKNKHIYIVNRVISGMYPSLESSYHFDEAEAAEAFEAFKAGVDIDPELIELIKLDPVTLDATHRAGWEGTIDDLNDDDEESDEDDWIVEGKPE